MTAYSDSQLQHFADSVKTTAKALGFHDVGISDIDLSRHEKFLQAWLDNGYHGDMQFMQNHGMKRARPAELLPGTVRVVCVRLNYLPPDASFARTLKQNQLGYISRYAVGRDYHKVLRNKLKKLGEALRETLPEVAFRPFVDSAPVLEHALAEKAGIGWTGKHSLTLSKQAGSWFFLGELFINLPLPVDSPVEPACGSCTACMTLCPTGAIVEPYVVDARKCISYLTIELDGSIPEPLRSKMGNRIYGCDDCQLACPWNRFAPLTDEPDFEAREGLLGLPLTELFSWSESQFLKRTEGSPIRRIGFQRWRRNIAVAMGNADSSDEIIAQLKEAISGDDPLVAEHAQWALDQQLAQQNRESRHTQRLIRVVEKGLPRDA